MAPMDRRVAMWIYCVTWRARVIQNNCVVASGQIQFIQLNASMMTQVTSHKLAFFQIPS